MDILDILPDLETSRLKTLGYSLIFGNWTTQPPGQLFKYKDYLITLYKDEEEIIEKLNKVMTKRLLCTRESINRHGFCLTFQKVDIMEFTEEYGAQLIKNKSHRKNYVDQMRKFKEYAEDITEKNNGKFYFKVLESIIYLCEDANNLEKEKQFIINLVNYFESEKISEERKNYVVKNLLKCSKNSSMRRMVAKLDDFKKI